MNIDDTIKEILNETNKNTLKKINENVYLKLSQIEILDKYQIDYKSVSSMKELIFLIEDILEECFYPDDLENVSLEISEFNYYNYTNK